MNLGTISFKNKIYNLDYMNKEEIENLLNNIEEEKAKTKREIKKYIS